MTVERGFQTTFSKDTGRTKRWSETENLSAHEYLINRINYIITGDNTTRSTNNIDLLLLARVTVLVLGVA